MLLISNSFTDSSSRQNARMTRTPVRFSRVSPVTRSRAACTFLKSGMLTSIMKMTPTNKSGIATTNTSAHLKLMVNAMIMEPMTMNGLRRRRRSPMLIPFCTWLISSVIRVIRVSVPIVSSSVKENPWMWSNTACLKLVAQPTLALAAKYCAVKLQLRPTAAIRISTRNIFTM